MVRTMKTDFVPITKELKSFLNSPAGRLVEEVPGVYLGGGAIRRDLSGEGFALSDYDIFFDSLDTRNTFENALKDSGYNEVFRCPKGTLTTYRDSEFRGIQAIGVMYGTGEEHAASFDFTVCSYTYNRGVLNHHPDAVVDTSMRLLKPNNITKPNATFMRINKYLSYGYKITKELILAYNEAVIRYQNEESAWEWYVD